MEKLSFKRHCYPADVIRYAVLLYYRFTLSAHDARRGSRCVEHGSRCSLKQRGRGELHSRRS
jgi:hypothetical protein